MPIWIGVLLIVALVALVLYFAFVAHRNALEGRERVTQVIKQRDDLSKDLQGTRATIKARDIEMGVLHGEKMQLHAENADLREALQEAQAEIKALNMRTIEVPEVAPEPVKRTTRKKAGAQ